MQSGQTKYGTGMTVSACLWLGLFPLIQSGSYRNITMDKWICMLILTGITLGCFLADALARRISRPRLLPLLCGAGLLCWTVLSCLLSPFPGTPWWIGTGRREGLASQLCYLCLFFLFSFSKIRRRPVLISAGCGLLVFFAVVMLQRSGGNPFGLYPDDGGYSSSPSYQGTIGNVDMCSGYLVIVGGLFWTALTEVLPEWLHSIRNRPVLSASGDVSFSPAADSSRSSVREKTGIPSRLPVRFFVLLLAFAISFYLIVTMKVASGLLALTVLMICTLVRLIPKKYRPAVLILLIAAVLLLIWYWPGQGDYLWELHEMLHARPQLSFGSGRVGVWIRTFTMLKEENRLWLGTGTDTFAMRFNTFLNRYELMHPDAEFLTGWYDSPHCEYLAVLANCGIPALLCFLALMLAGCSGAPAWRGSVLAYCVQALLSFSVCLVAPMFWVVLGLSCPEPAESR